LSIFAVFGALIGFSGFTDFGLAGGLRLAVRFPMAFIGSSPSEDFTGLLTDRFGISSKSSSSFFSILSVFSVGSLILIELD
jgi:hypothetical protein